MVQKVRTLRFHCRGPGSNLAGDHRCFMLCDKTKQTNKQTLKTTDKYTNNNNKKLSEERRVRDTTLVAVRMEEGP